MIPPDRGLYRFKMIDDEVPSVEHAGETSWIDGLKISKKSGEESSEVFRPNLLVIARGRR